LTVSDVANYKPKEIKEQIAKLKLLRKKINSIPMRYSWLKSNKISGKFNTIEMNLNDIINELKKLSCDYKWLHRLETPSYWKHPRWI